MAEPVVNEQNFTTYSSYLHEDQQRQLANDIATQAYNNKKAAGESEDRALAAAKFAWEQVKDRANLTGRFEDSWTMPTQQWFTEQFGQWMPGGPQGGQQTLAAQQQLATNLGTYQGQQTQAAQQQAFQQAQALAAMYGSYYQPGQTPTGGMQTQAAQEQQYTQWLRAAQEARANQTAQQQAAQSYLTLLSNLRGPADWAKYQQVLGATPGGMRDLTAAAMGQYIPGGGATSGYQPQAVNLNTLQGDVAGYGQQGYSAFTPGGQIQQAAAQQPQGQNQQYNAAGNGTNTMGAPQQNQMNLPAPNQIAPQTWKNLAPSQQELIKGEYEAQGWYKPDVEALMNQALPRYAANAPGAGTWRLK